MTLINLIPWREQERQTKKIRFGIILASAILLTLIVVVILHLSLNRMIASQQKSNDFLEAELAKENASLGTLNAKKKLLIAINNDLKFIFSLKESSYQALRLVDGLPRIVPDAVWLTVLTRENKIATVIGRAESNLQVTLFMENIAKSKIFSQPVLTEISEKVSDTEDERFFKLKFTL